MKMKMLTALVSVSIILGMIGVANATLINLNGETNTQGNPVTLFFEAGNYSVDPVGVADGGLYNAQNIWNWGQVDLPDVGWMHRYAISSLELGEVIIWDGVKYASDIEALNHAISTSFSLSTASDVSFYVLDGGPTWDNVGGISLDVNPSTPTPEPSTMLLLGTGIAGLVGSKRRSKRK